MRIILYGIDLFICLINETESDFFYSGDCNNYRLKELPKYFLDVNKHFNK